MQATGVLIFVQLSRTLQILNDRILMLNENLDEFDRSQHQLNRQLLADGYRAVIPF